MPFTSSLRRRATVLALAGALVTAPATLSWGTVAVAHAQDATIPVPAGQTTTVSLPVPVDVNMAADGWSVSASGGSATVTAPEAGGQLSVPVSYEGMSMTILLVADADVTADELNDAAQNGDPESLGGSTPGGEQGGGPAGGENPEGSAPGRGDAAEGDGGSAGDGAADGAGHAGSGEAPHGESGNAGQPAPPRTGRGWEDVDTSGTSYVNLESTIDGQAITAKLGFKQALDLYNRFKHLENDGVTLRYLNAEGEFVQGVKRDIDKGSRTMTLTYPEGQEPDNPFIMQFYNKDTQSAELVVTLTDPNQANAAEVPPEQQLGADGDNAAEASGDEDGSSGRNLAISVVIAAVVAVLVGLGRWWWRRRKV